MPFIFVPALLLSPSPEDFIDKIKYKFSFAVAKRKFNVKHSLHINVISENLSTELYNFCLINKGDDSLG